MNNKLNILLLSIFATLVIYSLVTFFAFSTNYRIINVILILLAINIVFNSTMVLIFNKKKSRLLKEAGLNNIDLKQIAGLEKVKTIIFSKQGIISEDEYELINVEHRSTVNRKSIIETALQLSKLWESPYTEVLNESLEKEPEEKKFSITKKLKEGILVTDGNENNLMLGVYSFVQEFVKKDDGYTLYLIKNKIPIGKFTFKEKLNKKSIKLAQALNSYGNLVYLDSEFNNSNSMLPFDRAYVSMNNEEQKNIISKLSVKAKTALITTNNNLTGIADYDFLISESNYKQTSENHINPKDLLLIGNIFSISKKVQTQLGYALYIVLLFNIALLIIAKLIILF